MDHKLAEDKHFIVDHRGKMDFAGSNTTSDKEIAKDLRAAVRHPRLREVWGDCGRISTRGHSRSLGRLFRGGAVA